MLRIMTTRDQIIEKTCELLELQGYHATGLNQIVRESHSPKGSLYYHFPGGKEELAIESIRRAGRMVLERIQVNLAEVDDSVESVRAFILNIAVNVERSGYRAGGPITTVALETASSHELLREECQAIYDGWQAAFADKLIKGGLASERAASVSRLIIAAIEGGIILCRTHRSPQPLQQVAEEIANLLRHSQ